MNGMNLATIIAEANAGLSLQQNLQETGKGAFIIFMGME